MGVPFQRKRPGRLADVRPRPSRPGAGEGALCRRAGSVRRRRKPGAGQGRRRAGRYRLRDPAVGHRHRRCGRGEGRGVGRVPGQHLQPVRGRQQGGDRRRLCPGRAYRPAAICDQPGLRAFHGAARRDRGVGPGRGALHALRRRAIPAPGAPGARHPHLQDPGKPHPGHRRRCRRRVRHQGLAIPRAPPRAAGGEATAPAGQMGLRAQRGDPRRRARPRQHQRSRAGARR